MALTKTPHINVLDETLGFGKTVLLPGDPLRAKYIAENFLENPVLINNVRGVNGYTGFYNGVKVSVMASGMGMPSMGIYSYELYKYFGVQNILRIGSAGGMAEGLQVKDIVAGIGACTNSSYGTQYELPGTIAPVGNFDMLCAVKESAEEVGVKLHIGNLLSSDTFYDDSGKTGEWAKMGCLAVEMEAAALYMNALRLKRRALAICTISDLLVPPYSALSAEEREKSFTDMMEIALKTAVKLESLPLLEDEA